MGLGIDEPPEIEPALSPDSDSLSPDSDEEPSDETLEADELDRDLLVSETAGSEDP